MCGKFTQMYSWSEIHAIFAMLVGGDAPGGDASGGANDYEETVTPMRQARMVRRDATGGRELVLARWGWPDRRAATPLLDRPRHMHAKSETVDALPSFGPSFHAGRRGIVPVRTFNVGEAVGARVIQHVLAPHDGKPLGIAVIYDTVATSDGREVLAFVMLTTAPTPQIARVTDRMPALLAPEDWATWLGEPAARVAAIMAPLVPYPGGLDMAAQPKAPPKRRAGATPASLL